MFSIFEEIWNASYAHAFNQYCYTPKLSVTLSECLSLENYFKNFFRILLGFP